jgi:HAD superfamily hydrolase (TIGR01459 family)
MKHLQRLRDIADPFDGFIVDLWGVIHDGVHALPGAIDCLAAMRHAGKRIVLLSNAPRRSRLVEAQLEGLGVTRDLYDHVVTSGEITREMLIARTDPFFAALGSRLYHLGPQRDANVLENVEGQPVARLDGADWLLNTGPDDEHPAAIEHYQPLLEEAAGLRLPMVCANPDLEIVRGGERIICAGLLARIYAGLGGAVRLVGKPDPAIYGPVISRLDVPPERICAIGDALATDIAGATSAGLASIWILGGIHHHLVGDPYASEAEAETAGLAPIATLPSFTW